MRHIACFFLFHALHSSSFILPTLPKRARLIQNAKNPADIIKELSYVGQPAGEPWTYNEYLTHLDNKEVNGVSLLTDHNVLNTGAHTFRNHQL